MRVEASMRRLAIALRWISIGWIVVVYALPPMLPGGVPNWEEFFDNSVLVGVIPGVGGLLLSYVIAKSVKSTDRPAPDVSPP
jgi:hypothetical protein